jgi:HSP20 family protein
MFFNPRQRRNVWDQVQEMERVFAGIDQLFDSRRGRSRVSDAAAHPPINIWANVHAVLVTAELPGLDPASIAITTIGDTLTMRAEDAPDAAGELRQRERPRLAFSRSVQLPFPVDADRTEARYEKGVLAVVLRRPEQQKPTKITVKAA